jgi:hypothetical protein
VTVHGRALFVAICAALCDCSSPSVTRSEDGLLILDGEYPKTFNASEGFGVLVAKGSCLVYTAKGLGELQPVFPKGETRADLDRRLGNLDKPRAVTVGGPDPYSAVIKNVAGSPVAKECPGTPFIMSGIHRVENSTLPP